MCRFYRLSVLYLTGAALKAWFPIQFFNEFNPKQMHGTQSIDQKLRLEPRLFMVPWQWISCGLSNNRTGCVHVSIFPRFCQNPVSGRYAQPRSYMFPFIRPFVASIFKKARHLFYGRLKMYQSNEQPKSEPLQLRGLSPLIVGLYCLQGFTTVKTYTSSTCNIIYIYFRPEIHLDIRKG